MSMRRQPLDDAQPDQFERAGAADAGGEPERDRGQGEDQEAEVVDPHAPVDIAEATERDHQHGAHDQVAHQHPEEVADVARA
jgi:hypothetical protein